MGGSVGVDAGCRAGKVQTDREAAETTNVKQAAAQPCQGAAAHTQAGFEEGINVFIPSAT